MGPLGGESAVVSSKASLKMKFELLSNNLQAVKEGMGMKENIALDRGVHCQTLKDVMRDISTGRPERALMITSMEGATLCLNLDLFHLYSPLLRSIAQCAFWVQRWPCGQNGPVYATGPYYVAHVVDTGP